MIKTHANKYTIELLKTILFISRFFKPAVVAYLFLYRETRAELLKSLGLVNMSFDTAMEYLNYFMKPRNFGFLSATDFDQTFSCSSALLG